MQTIGNSDEKMSFPATWTDILLKSIATSGRSANYTIDVKIGTKRISSEYQPNTPGEILSKKRRKQSNPTRISSCNVNNKKQSFTDNCKSEEPEQDYIDHSSNDSSSLSTNASFSPLNLSKPEIQLQQQSVRFVHGSKTGQQPIEVQKPCIEYVQSSPLNSEIQHMVDHVQSSPQDTNGLSHVTIPSNRITLQQNSTKELNNVENLRQSKIVPEMTEDHSSIDDVPLTWIQRYGSHGNHLANLKTSQHEESTSFNVTSANILKNDSILNSPSAVQIFNPEAYCDQCNKEFCNKYFLKTHKANKHGVYSEPSQYYSPESLDQIKSYNQYRQNFLFSNNRQQNLLLNQPVQDVIKPSSPVMQSKIVQGQGVSQQSSTAVIQLLTKNLLYNSSNASNTSGRAFCDICQKEFCNKYFVKRHKAKIHGIFSSEEGGSSVDYNIFEETLSNIKCTSKRVQVQRERSRSREGLERGEIPHTCESHLQSIQGENIQLPLQKNAQYVENKTQHGAADDILSRTLMSKVTLNNKYINSTSELVVEKFDKDYINNISQVRSEDNPLSIKMEVINSYSNVNDVAEFKREPIATPDVDEVETGDCVSIQTEETRFSRDSEWQALRSPSTVVCDVCDQPVDRSSLKVHLLAEHEELFRDLFDDSMSTTGGDDIIVKYFTEHEGKGYGIKRLPSIYDEYTNVKDFNKRSSATNSTLSSFCRICNKELCNKYFMKTHMQRMHGISIQNGNHIGGVMCDICNKELCSKYFLKVHKQNSHGIFDPSLSTTDNVRCSSRDGVGVINFNSDNKNISSVGGIISSKMQWPDNGHPPPSTSSSSSDEPMQTDIDHRYYKHYTEVCDLCGRRFRSSKWLSAHLFNDHGDEGRALYAQNQSQIISTSVVNGKENENSSTIIRNAKTVTEETDSVESVLEDITRTDEDPNKQAHSALEETKKNHLTSKTHSMRRLTYFHENALKYNYEQNKETKQETQDKKASVKDSSEQYRCSYCNFTTSILSFLFVHEKFHDAVERHHPKTTNSGEKTYQHEHDNDPQSANGDLKRTEEVSGIHDQKSKDLTEELAAVDIDTTTVEKTALSSNVDIDLVRKNSAVTTAMKLNSGADSKKMSHNEPFIMQSFFLENCSVSPASANNTGNGDQNVIYNNGEGSRSDSFYSSLVYLPVKEKLTSTVNVFFKLTPT
ncbi:uncharacterized protein LOC126897553 [Daktulosphaira vitifoliae]|uniref:uncharacterized protein LOC126897553 n=1 Tax=Daktulosphaira vitifoliae TaxID=58002 RepID=UPI0021AA3B06|nr:uncharacterized protein LOC126897553 [Daktulosphaira vitifoliae]